MLGLLKEIYKKSPNNVGVSFINKKAPVRRLFEPEAFQKGKKASTLPVGIGRTPKTPQ